MPEKKRTDNGNDRGEEFVRETVGKRLSRSTKFYVCSGGGPSEERTT